MRLVVVSHFGPADPAAFATHREFFKQLETFFSFKAERWTMHTYSEQGGQYMAFLYRCGPLVSGEVSQLRT